MNRFPTKIIRFLSAGRGQWCRGKTFATFCPLGPALVTTDEITNPNRLSIRTILNGQTLQDWKRPRLPPYRRRRHRDPRRDRVIPFNEDQSQ